MRFRWRRVAAVVLALTMATSIASAATAGAKTTKKKAAAKKTTKRKGTTSTTAKKVVRQIAAPTAVSTSGTGRPRPTNVDPTGELVISYAAPASSLDPAKNSLRAYTAPLYDRLMYADDNMNVVPMLATSWHFPSKSVFEMTLRNDVTFEDGTKFDAESVKATIERYQKLSGSVLAPQLRTVTSIEVVSPTVVRLHLSAGGAELPALFATEAGMMISTPVAKSMIPLDNGPKGGGSGPYVVDKFTPNVQYVVKPSSAVEKGTYWDKGAGLLRKLTIVYLATSPQRINAVRSGDIDVGQVTGQDTAPAQSLVDSGQGYSSHHVTLQLTQVNMLIHQDKPPMDNKLFRQALMIALDKKAIAKGFYGGNCDPAKQFFSSRHWAHSKTVEGRDNYDQEKAQRLIKESGIFNPTFTLQTGPIYQGISEAVAGLLGDYGINVKIKSIPQTDLTFRDNGADEAQMTSLINGVDPSQLVTNYYLPNGVFKLAKDPDGSLAAAAAAAADPTISQAAAAKIYDGIWQKVNDQAVVMHVCNTHQVWLQKGDRANLKDIGFTWSGLVDFRYLYVKR